MNCEKEPIVNIVSVNDGKSSFRIYYNDYNLCFKNDDHKKGNVFYIFKDNILYLPLRELFKQLKRTDRFCYMHRKGTLSKFEWMSDGKKDCLQNKLVIVETLEGYRIEFIKRDNTNESCIVKFSLSNSNNQTVSNLFDQMAYNINIMSVRKMMENGRLI